MTFTGKDTVTPRTGLPEQAAPATVTDLWLMRRRWREGRSR